MKELQIDGFEDSCSRLESALSLIQKNYIQAGIAAVDIKKSCDLNPNGTTNFPAVMKSRFGLGKTAATELLHIGQNAERLYAVAYCLPRESRSTLNVIAGMDDATITDKIERGCITPASTRDDVLEQKRVTKEITVAVDDPNTPDLSAVEVYATLSTKHQKSLEAHIQGLMTAYRKKVRKEVDAENKKLTQDTLQLAASRKALEEAMRMVKNPFTREEFKRIRSFLAPDNNKGNEEKAAELFNIFMRIEPVCNKASSLKAVS